jgi:hypothetical protein
MFELGRAKNTFHEFSSFIITLYDLETTFALFSLEDAEVGGKLDGRHVDFTASEVVVVSLPLQSESFTEKSTNKRSSGHENGGQDSQSSVLDGEEDNTTNCKALVNTIYIGATYRGIFPWMTLAVKSAT